MDEILKLSGVSLSYMTPQGETNALSGFDLSVKRGEFVSLVGPSGCGKTTILSLISGLIKSTSGSVEIAGTPVSGASPLVGYMLQRDQLFGWRTILSNALLGLEIRKMKTPENVAFTTALLEKYGLGDFKKHYPHQLSGGMRQRAALIRTLATRPELLLLDEPFSALDYQTRLSVASDVSDIIRSEGKTAVLVTHDISEAISVSDRVAVLSARPAAVKKVFTLDFTEKNPLKRRECKQFPHWFDIIWKELQDK